jgi:predicted Zn-ribbon and HTH transcriptional regulator
MPRKKTYPVVEVYGCKKCAFQYESPVRLSGPPIHRCPTPKSSRTAMGVLLESFPDPELREESE